MSPRKSDEANCKRTFFRPCDKERILHAVLKMMNSFGPVHMGAWEWRLDIEDTRVGPVRFVFRHAMFRSQSEPTLCTLHASFRCPKLAPMWTTNDGGWCDAWKPHVKPEKIAAEMAERITQITGKTPEGTSAGGLVGFLEELQLWLLAPDMSEGTLKYYRSRISDAIEEAKGAGA